MDPRLEPAAFWPRLQAALDGVPEESRTPPPDGRVGAVLVLLEEDAEEGLRVVLTRRRRDLRSHPGQLSFAGGRLDPGETIEEAAIREAVEEIGLRPETVETVGAGPTFFIPPSRFWVVPVAARWHTPHDVDPNPWEVDEVLRVPLSTLLEPERLRKVPLSDRGASWAWQLDDDLLWGATAVVLSLLLDVAVEGWAGDRAPEDLPDDRSVKPWEDMPTYQARRARLEGDLPEVPQAQVTHVTAEQMRAVDQRLTELGLDLAQLASHAGRALAHAGRRLIGGDLDAVRATVLAGSGGNGAGGRASALLLAVAGADVTVLQVGEPALPGQDAALEAAGVTVVEIGEGGPGDDMVAGQLVIDALLGYGANPPLRGAVAATVGWLRRHDVRVVSLDLPSGVDATDGLKGPCVTADVTVTLAAPKTGLQPAIVQPYVGDLYVADIGVPRSVWQDVGVSVPLVFGRGPLVRLTVPEVVSDKDTPDQGVTDA